MVLPLTVKRVYSYYVPDGITLTFFCVQQYIYLIVEFLVVGSLPLH